MLRKWNLSRRNYKRDRANNRYSEDNHLHSPGTWREVAMWQIEGKLKLRVCSITQDIIHWYLQRIKSNLFSMACKAFQHNLLPVCSVSCSSHTHFPLPGIFSSLPMGQIPFPFTSLCLSITSSLIAFLSLSILAHQTLAWKLLYEIVYYLLKFYWNIVDLQCCVSFRYTVKWFSCTHI